MWFFNIGWNDHFQILVFILSLTYTIFAIFGTLHVGVGNKCELKDLISEIDWVNWRNIYVTINSKWVFKPIIFRE